MAPVIKVNFLQYDLCSTATLLLRLSASFGTLIGDSLKLKASESKRRRRRGFDMFMSEHFAQEPHDVVTMARRAHLERKWKREISEDVKAHYKSRAEEYGRQHFTDDTLREFVDKGLDEGLRDGFRQQALRHAAKRTFEAMITDPVFAAGTQLQCFGSALKSDCIIHGCSNAVAKSRAADLFKYNPVGKPSSADPLTPFKSCRMRNGGLCDNDDVVDSCNIAASNVFVALSEGEIIEEGKACAGTDGNRRRQRSRASLPHEVFQQNLGFSGGGRAYPAYS